VAFADGARAGDPPFVIDLVAPVSTEVVSEVPLAPALAGVGNT